MLTTTALLEVTLLAVSATVTATLGAYAFRHRQEPGATPFGLLMLSLAFWSGGYAVALLTLDPGWRILWEGVQWIGASALHFCLLLFALEYTGHDEFVNRRVVGLLSVVPVATLVVVWTNPVHEIFWTVERLTVVDGLAILELSYTTLFLFYTIYTYVVVAIAVGLILRLVVISDYLYADQSALLVVGIVTPLVTNVADVFVLSPGLVIDLTPIAFTVTGLAFGYALFRQKLFDLVPATRQLGRNAAISQLDAGMVIVDNAHRIVYCNAAAGKVLDCEPADALGVAVHSLIDESRIDFGTEDALVEVARDDCTYEIRTSPISDRRDRRIGHTLVVHDVTARKERERRLAVQRDELATVNDLNAVLRGVNQGLVSATNREEIERTVCERIVEADLYRTACIGDIPTWTGDADRWFVAGDGGENEPSPPALDVNDLEGESIDVADGEYFDVAGDGTTDVVDGEDLDVTDESATHGVTPTDVADGGTWTVVPLVYGRTVYGALGLYTEQSEVSDRERTVLGELGETVGHAINAVETRRLLSAEAVVELELRSEDEDDPLVAASAGASCRLVVAGIVPGSDDTYVAYVRVEGAETRQARDCLRAAATGAVRTIRDGEDDGLLEWQVAGDAVLRSLEEHGAHVQQVHADGGQTSYELEIASEADVRAMVDHVERRFPDTRVVSKRERSRPVDRPDAVAGQDLSDLTDRQREVIETAYQSGYYNWPRDSTAEDVAETLDISSATLHSHLRKAQQSLLRDIFDDDAG